ncbi:MAG TPA: hypothetical protein VGL35_00465 [Rhizomicrobium sp.]|jgi:outer membrane protein OmpA-like peptidoglycan-associated protein
MATTYRIRARLLARVAAPLFFAAALSACSSVPDWVDPTSWMGGGDNQVSSDQSANTGAADGQTPDLASIPPKPSPPSTPEEQQQVANSLVADRAEAHYSAEALKGGNEPSAPPPPPAAPAAANPVPGNSAAAAAPAESDNSAEPANSASTAEAPSAPAPSDEAAAAATPPASTEQAPAAGAENNATPEASGQPVNQIASTEPAAPAAAPMAPETAPSNMQTTFAPSKAPALDPSISRYVPAQVLSQYRATAAEAASPDMQAGDIGSGIPGKHRHHHHKKTSLRLVHNGRHLALRWRHNWRLAMFRHQEKLAARRMRERRYAAVRHREKFFAIAAARAPGLASREAAGNGALIPANFGEDEEPDPASLRTLSSLLGPASRSAVAVVVFPGDATALNHSAQNRIRAAARAFAANGSVGFVKVVGHSATAPPGLSRAARLKVDMVRSESQATAVARELIRDGVPPGQVMVEADGAGAHGAGHRSAEIFLQS